MAPPGASSAQPRTGRGTAGATPPRLLQAIDEINIVRARAGLGPKTILDLPTQQAVLDEIYRQRTYSLFGMGLHWADQRRFGRISEAKVRYLPYPAAEESSNPNTPDNHRYDVTAALTAATSPRTSAVTSSST